MTAVKVLWVSEKISADFGRCGRWHADRNVSRVSGEVPCTALYPTSAGGVRRSNI